ncbi:MAG: FHA domain-containing protein [Polyangiaceae bacterium]|nr:FHA domain-containing protein [Polyangiaceae bacterium]
MIVYWLKHRGTEYPVHRGDCILGRSPACLIVLSAQQISREHAVICLRGEALQIEDLGSRNGTAVNGRLLTGMRRLYPGDIIEIGSERLEVLRKVSREISSTVDADSADEDPSVVAQRSALELAEELLARAAEAGERTAVARTIQSMVDAVVNNAKKNGRALTKGEVVRLVSVAQVVATWFRDGSMNDWAEGVRNALESDC